ncbi:MAG: DUF6525 family protein [Janthinobacterium lividum]
MFAQDAPEPKPLPAPALSSSEEWTAFDALPAQLRETLTQTVLNTSAAVTAGMLARGHDPEDVAQALRRAEMTEVQRFRAQVGLPLVGTIQRRALRRPAARKPLS